MKRSLRTVILGILLAAHPADGQGMPTAQGTPASIALDVNFDAPQLIGSYIAADQQKLIDGFPARVKARLGGRFEHWNFELGARDAPFAVRLTVENLGNSEQVDLVLSPRTRFIDCAEKWPHTWKTGDQVLEDGHGTVPEVLDGLEQALEGLLESHGADVESCLLGEAPIASSSSWSEKLVVLPLSYDEHHPRLKGRFDFRVMCEGGCDYPEHWLASMLIRESADYPPGGAEKLFDALLARPKNRRCGDELSRLRDSEVGKLELREVYLIRRLPPRGHDYFLADVVPETR